MQLEDYFHAYGSRYEDVKRKSKIIFDPSDLNRFTNKLNIDFNPALGKIATAFCDFDEAAFNSITNKLIVTIILHQAIMKQIIHLR